MNVRMLDRFFWVSLVLKAIDAVFELVGGVLLFFVTKAQLLRWAKFLFQHELTEDPHDFFANLLFRMLHHLSIDQRIFAAIYLSSHGIIKLVLVAALLKGRLRIYPIAGAIFTLFLIFQIYQLALKFSLFYVFLSILDVIVIALIFIEYRVKKRQNREL